MRHRYKVPCFIKQPIMRKTQESWCTRSLLMLEKRKEYMTMQDILCWMDAMTRMGHAFYIILRNRHVAKTGL